MSLSDKQLDQLLAKENPVDTVMAIVANVVADWHAENNEKTIKQKVYDILDEQQEKVVWALMGFKKSDFNIDWNPSKGSSHPTQEHFLQIYQEAIKTWLLQIGVPELSDEDKERLEKVQRRAYFYQFEAHLRDITYKQASADAERLVEILTTSKKLEKLEKAFNLIKDK